MAKGSAKDAGRTAKNGATVGYEAQLWQMADALRGAGQAAGHRQTGGRRHAAFEWDNNSLKGVLPKDYARPALDKTHLGQLIDLISNIRVGDEESRAKDVLGRA